MLLLRRQGLETVRLDLDEGGAAHAFYKDVVLFCWRFCRHLPGDKRGGENDQSGDSQVSQGEPPERALKSYRKQRRGVPPRRLITITSNVSFLPVGVTDC